MRILIIGFFVTTFLIFCACFTFAQNPEKRRDTIVLFEHTPPLSQAYSSSCWSFAATSFIESEHYRMYRQTINLSEQWFVYWDFVDKAKMFATLKKGKEVPIGSELNSVTERIMTMGAVPFEIFKGTNKTNNRFDYDNMYDKLQIEVVKQSKKSIYEGKPMISILNQTMGVPPDTFIWQGVSYTPLSYFKEVVKFNPKDYFSFMSTATKTFNERGELVEPDNWWNSADYYNLPIEKFIEALCEALTNGFTVALCGDVSEIEYQIEGKSIIFDSINYASIDSLRMVYQLNGSTTNDHCWHVVGYQIKNGEWWFLVKDSSYIDSKDSYHWLHESYVRLKAMSMMMHKYAARKVVNEIIK